MFLVSLCMAAGYACFKSLKQSWAIYILENPNTNLPTFHEISVSMA